MKTGSILITAVACLVFCSNSTTNGTQFACSPITSAQYEQLRRALLSTKGSFSQGWCVKRSGNVTSCSDTSLQSRHPGVDYGAGVGIPVYAPAGGTVVRVSKGSRCRTSKCLSTLAIYNEQRDVTFVFLHMDSILVSVGGPPVNAGDQIGTVGQRGPASGPHLHYEVRPGRRTSASLCVSDTLNPYSSTF